MDYKKFVNSLVQNGEAFLKDDFLGVAVMYRKVSENEKEVFLKWKGRAPAKVSYDNKTAFDIEMDKDSVQITKDEYENY